MQFNLRATFILSCTAAVLVLIEFLYELAIDNWPDALACGVMLGACVYVMLWSSTRLRDMRPKTHTAEGQWTTARNEIDGVNRKPSHFA